MLPFVSGGAQISATAQITTALSAEIDIDPVLGGRLDVGNGAFVIQMPAGAFTSTHRLVFEGLKPNRERDGKVQLLLTAFSLRALDKKTAKETTQFSKAVTIQVRYDPKWVQGWRASDLTLAYWDPKRKQWFPVASQVDTARHTVTAQTTHFSDWGLVQDPDIQTYIPNVQSAEPNLFLGSSTASYDLQVPPGRNGLVPKLSLSYSSSSVDMADEFQNGSFLGMGWSFSTSYIARDTRSSYSLDDDVFSLVMNGSGYDLVKGADGNYHTAQDQYWRISFYPAQNQNYWLVTTKDGTQYQFGSTDGTAGSRAVEYLAYPGAPVSPTQQVTYAWWLEKVVDTHGNEIRYTYRHDSGPTNCGGRIDPPQVWDAGLYPLTIEYNGAGSTFLSRIDFTYSSRIDVRWVSTLYQCAVPMVNLKLDRIDVKTTDNANVMQLVRWYGFEYYPNNPLFPGYGSNPSPSTHGRLALKSIRHKGSDGSSILSTYTATYGPNNRLESVDNGIGGQVSFVYPEPLVFTDPNSPRTVWIWPHDSISARSATVTPNNEWSYAVNGDQSGTQYAVLGTGWFIPDTYYNFIPGAHYDVDVYIKAQWEQPCAVQLVLWDGVQLTPLTGWVDDAYHDYPPKLVRGGFRLAHNATAVELRLYVKDKCEFHGTNGLLHRTLYRVSERKVADGQGNLAATTYAYEGPLIAQEPRTEYQFRGHSKVTVTDPAAVKTDYYYYQDAVLLGRVWKTTQYSGSSIYTATENQYGQRLTAVASPCARDPFQCPNPVNESSNYVYTSVTIRDTYDGQPTYKRAQTAYTPDAYGNISVTDEYDVAAGTVYRRTATAFYANTTNWIVNKHQMTSVYAGPGTTLESRVAYWFDNNSTAGAPVDKADLTHVWDWDGDANRWIARHVYGYDPYGNQTSDKGPLAPPTTTQYDTTYHMFPMTITNPLGQGTTNTYDYRRGKILTTTDPNNATTEYAYDVFGRTTSIWQPLDRGYGATTKYDYSVGSPRSMVHVQVRSDAGGANTPTYQHAWWYYDGLGRVIQQQSTGLNSTLILVNTAYDSRGQTWKVSNPYTVTASGGTYQMPNWAQPYTEHLYDAVGREARTIKPDGNILWYVHLHWTTTFTDENYNDKETLADAFGRTVQVKEWNQGQPYTTTYSYDVTDRLRIVMDSTGSNTIVTNYDWLGRKKEMFDPDLGHWTYKYDDASNLIQQTDAKGQRTCLYNDELNRFKGKNYQSDTSECPFSTSSYTVAYGYDDYNGESQFGRGRRTSMTDASGTTAWVYDKQGRLTRQTNTISGAPDSSYTTGWTYDAMDRARSMIYPDGETVSMTYNEQTLVKDLTSPLSNYVTGCDYNAASELTRLDMGNGTRTIYGYDAQNLRMIQLRSTSFLGTLQDLSYEYDPVGNLKTLRDYIRGEVSTFGYDDLDRLTGVNLSGGASPYSAAWAYNPIGNITQAVQSGVTTNYAYGDANHKHAATQVGTQALSYDANGNMTYRNGDVLNYDEENRLQRVTANGTTTVYAYNGDGQRVKREVGQSGGYTTTFYVGNWLEVETFTQSTPAPTNTPPPTLTPTLTPTPTNTPVPTSTPTPQLPGSGPLQTQGEFVVGNTMWQSYWRGDQGWYRTAPIGSDEIQWGSASAWSGPYSIGMPGSGTVQVQTDFVIGNTMWRSFWRGDQGWYRSIPIVNDVIQWSSAAAWAGPYSITAMPGSGTLQTQYDVVIGTTLWQNVWRGDQGWRRTVPIVNGAPDYNSASAWAGPYSISGMPGSGTLQSQSDFVIGSTYWQYVWRGDQGWSRSAPIVNGVIQWGSASAWSGPVSIGSMPGGGSIQAESDVVLGSTFWQYIWRGDQEWSRSVPIVNGVIQWGQASAWTGACVVCGMPGSGVLQTQYEAVIGSSLWQNVWRGDQGWRRIIPIVNNQVQWNSAEAWAGPYSISGQPGSGALQAESDVVLGTTVWQYVWRDNKEWSRSVPIVNGVPQFGSASAWTLKSSATAQLEGSSYWCWLSTSNAGGSDGSALRNTTAVSRDTERSGNCAPPPPALASPARTLGGTVTKYYYFGSQRVAMRRGDTLSYLYGDHLGSTSVTAEGIGGNPKRQTYYAYGTVRTTSGTLPTDYTFTGQKLDASTGLMYYGARYYDAAIGRFVQPDSIVPNLYNPQSLNRYSYVLNNPVRYTDPSGHGAPEDFLAFLQQIWRALTSSRYARGQACGLNVDPSCGGAANAARSPSVGGLLEAGEELSREKNKFNFGPPIIDPEMADAAKRAADIAGAVGTVRRARDIRFTQDSIGSSTQKGVPLDDLSQEIAEGKLRGTIKVVEKDGQLYSLDNRRLAAAQLIDAELPIEVLDLNDPAVQQYFEDHFTTENGGTSIEVRGTDIVIGPWDNDGEDLDDYYDDYD